MDVLVVSETLAYADLFAALEEAAARLGRPVNPTIFSRAELARRREQDNAFVTRMLAGAKIWLMGNEDALAAR